MVLRKTNIIEKFSASLINAIFILILSFPLFFIINDRIQWMISIVVIFFLYNLYIYIFYQNRCIGMRIIDTHWGEKFNFSNELLYIFLYTLSFSTLFLWFWFPFDIFLFNMFLQIVCIKITGTTIHGYISGMHTVRNININSSKKSLFRFLGYNVVSTITFIIDLILLWVLIEFFNFHYILSVVIGFLTATVLNYIFGRKIIFKETKQGRIKGYIISILISFSTFLVVLFFTWFFVSFVSLHYLLSRIIAGVIAGILSYIFDTKFTFRMPVFT